MAATPYIKINNTQMAQPFKMNFKLETTDSSTTTRTMSGALKGSPLFVVQAFDVSFERLTSAQCSQLLQAVIRRPGHATFTMYYFSPWYGSWRTDTFYCTSESLSINTVKSGSEKLSNLSMTFVATQPLA